MSRSSLGSPPHISIASLSRIGSSEENAGAASIARRARPTPCLTCPRCGRPLREFTVLEESGFDCSWRAVLSPSDYFYTACIGAEGLLRRGVSCDAVSDLIVNRSLPTTRQVLEKFRPVPRWILWPTFGRSTASPERRWTSKDA